MVCKVLNPYVEILLDHPKGEIVEKLIVIDVKPRRRPQRLVKKPCG
jgi:hypothetical protein